MTQPPPDPSPREAPRGRALHTALQLPSETRGSKSTSIVFSVLLHLVLILGLREWVWKPVVTREDRPVFQIFQLDAMPEPAPPPLLAPEIEPPSVSEALSRTELVTPQPEPAIDPRVEDDEDNMPPPGLVEPTGIPTTIPADAAPGVTAGSGRPGGAGAPRTAAERLLRTGIAPSLIPARPGQIPAAVTPEEAAAARMYAGMKQYNDSVAGAAEDARRATDWTKKGKDGERWGVSPGQIHLGSITLPLPFTFSGPTGRREETAGRLRSFAEANAQAQRLEVEQTFESRVKAMRARKDAQRDSARVKKGGG